MLPLFGPVPGGPELALVGVVGLVFLLVSVGAGYWVYTDANRRGTDNPAVWALATALGGVFGNLFGLVVVLVLYLLVGRE